jgi:hypothetical protein
MEPIFGCLMYTVHKRSPQSTDRRKHFLKTLPDNAIDVFSLSLKQIAEICATFSITITMITMQFSLNP